MAAPPLSPLTPVTPLSFGSGATGTTPPVSSTAGQGPHDLQRLAQLCLPYLRLWQWLPWRGQCSLAMGTHGPRLSLLLLWIDRLLRGISQVIFINNALSGAIFLVAGFVNSPFQTCCALTALLSSTLAAAVFNLPQELLDSGIYGYNAYLTGMGIALFQESGVKSEWNGLEFIPAAFGGVMACIFTVVLSKVLTSWGGGQPVAVFTLPFHMATWLWLLASKRYRYFPNIPGLQGEILTQTVRADRLDFVTYEALRVAEGVVVGVGQVFFHESVVSGYLIILGVAMASLWSAALAVLGSTLGVAVALAFGVAPEPVYLGLYGYNPVLAVMCVGGIFVLPSVAGSLLALLAGIMSTFLTSAWGAVLTPIGLPPLTFPAAATSVVFTIFVATTLPRYLVPLKDLAVPEAYLTQALSNRRGWLSVPLRVHPVNGERGTSTPATDVAILF